MTVADWAFVISICSAAISLAGFIWNVWSKFIYPKPKVRVGFSYVIILHPNDRSQDYELLCLSATNHGPGDATLTHALVRRKGSLFRKGGFGILNPLPGPVQQFDIQPGPFSVLPKRIGVGEQISVYLVPNHQPLSADDYDRIGFSDTFGKNHWAHKGDITRAKPHIREALERMGPAPR